jgi:hypothetical protein
MPAAQKPGFKIEISGWGGLAGVAFAPLRRRGRICPARHGALPGALAAVAKTRRSWLVDVHIPTRAGPISTYSAYTGWSSGRAVRPRRRCGRHAPAPCRARKTAADIGNCWSA